MSSWTSLKRPKSPSLTPLAPTSETQKAMVATPADVKDCPNSYVIVIDMPGLKQDEVKVQVEEGNLLVVSGERKREKEKEQGVKYIIKMERRLGKYLKKFQLPENADNEKISASYQEGVLTVTVEKKPPPEPKKPKTVQVQMNSGVVLSFSCDAACLLEPGFRQS
ncbi:hypothetical protein DITRI_Ditri10aG0104700 [Diplodiscus trichospermus]